MVVLDDMRDALHELVAGDTDRHPKVVHRLVTEDASESVGQPAVVVLWPKELTEPSSAVRENARAMLLVEVQHFSRCHPCRESERDDRAGQGANNEVEVVRQALTSMLLEVIETGGREEATRSSEK